MIITTTQEHVEVPGGKADKPTEIPARGWLQVAKRGWKEAKGGQRAAARRWCRLLRVPGHLSGTDRHRVHLWTLRRPGDDHEPAELDDRRTARTGQAGHHRSGHRTGLAALDSWYRPHHLGRDRVVERLGWDQQPADRDQCRLRRGRETRLREEAADVPRADPRRDRLHGDHARNRRRVAAAAESRIRDWGAALGPPDPRLAGARRARRCRAGDSLSSGAGPRRATHGLGIGWRHRRHGAVARCLDRVLDLYSSPSATTPRPMAFSPESWCCCSGSGSACTRSCSVPRSTPSPSSKRSRTRPRARRSRSASAAR